MSDDNIDVAAGSSTTSTEKRRSTVPNILPHQNSFENRYSHMIHKQILETSVNKEALKRQINAYFSCGGSFSISDKEILSIEDKSLDENAVVAAEGEADDETENRQTEESEKSPLHKAETVDIAELQK